MKNKLIAVAAIASMSVAGSSAVFAGEVTGGPSPKDNGMRDHAEFDVCVLRAGGEPDLPGSRRQREARAPHPDPALSDGRHRTHLRGPGDPWRRMQPVERLTGGSTGVLCAPADELREPLE